MTVYLCHILIISHHSLFIEALARLLLSVGAKIQGQAANIDVALSLLDTQKIDAVIIDRSGISQSETEMVSHLASKMDQYTVVFLASGDDQMTVYRRQQITYTEPDRLAQLLCSSK